MPGAARWTIAHATTGSPQKTFFLHVPGTGGSTFRSILASVYGPRFAVCDDPAISAIEQQKHANDCLEFHAVSSAGEVRHAHSELSRQSRWDLLTDAHVFTMLRDPVEHTITLFHQLMRDRATAEPRYQQHGLLFPDTLEQFLKSSQHFNTQLAFWADVLQISTLVPLGRRDLDRIKQLLLTLNVHVGLTEHFGRSMHVFEQVTGRTIPGAATLNQGRNPARPSPPGIPKKTRDFISERSQLDRELYCFGQELFRKDLARFRRPRTFSIFEHQSVVSFSSTVRAPEPRRFFPSLRPGLARFLVRSQ